MKNVFLVSRYRFHTKDKNKMLIIGWFRENLMGDNKLYVVMENQRLNYQIEEHDLAMSNLMSQDGIVITKQYYLWIDLPADWEQKKGLQIKNTNGNSRQNAFSLSVRKMRMLKNELQAYVEKWVSSGSEVYISGWYIDEGMTDVRFLDESGKPFEMEVLKRSRDDVHRYYPESLQEEVVGFAATYKGNIPRKICVCVEDAGKIREFMVPIQMTPVERRVSAVKKGVSKAKIYYYKNGGKSTIKKITNRVLGKDVANYKAWYKKHQVSKSVLKIQQRQKFSYMPKISIVVPLYRTPEQYLTEFIESVRNQSYSNWELCLSDGSGAPSPITGILKKYETMDSRIKVIRHEEPMQISLNTNAALDISTGEYIAFADHDDLLAPEALYECICELNKDADIDMIYTDEDKIEGGEHFMPHFKPDFNIDMLRSMNYICHLMVVKRGLYEKVGNLRQDYDGAQDYDFVLRCIEQASDICHIPKILYHWRSHRDSTAENPESKKYAFEAGKKAIQAHYDRLGIRAEVIMTDRPGIYRTKYCFDEEPLVSVIIPNKDHVNDLEKCLHSLDAVNQYTNMEYIIVENNSTEEKTFVYYEQLPQTHPKAKVVRWDKKGFNYPSINNYGVEQSKGEYVLLLNNDTEIINTDCIEELLSYCMRPEVGAVGARLYYEDGTIQHGGVVVGLGGVAGHVFVGELHESPGYMGRIIMAQDYSAVTAACMMIKRSVYEEIEGFDEQYAVAFNDVDLCLRIREKGYLIVYNPYAELNHYESKSRGTEDTEEKVQRFNSEIALFKSRWADILDQGDPNYSPNLTLEKNDFSLNIRN